MKIILKDGRRHILRFDRGEEAIEGLKTFCRNTGIGAAAFSGIGAASEITLSFYDLGEKIYRDTTFAEPFEITSLIGNVARMGDDLVIHAHGTFSDSAMQVRGGHAKRIIISGTCEVFLIALDGAIERARDEDTGLNLMR